MDATERWKVNCEEGGRKSEEGRGKSEERNGFRKRLRAIGVDMCELLFLHHISYIIPILWLLHDVVDIDKI